MTEQEQEQFIQEVVQNVIRNMPMRTTNRSVLPILFAIVNALLGGGLLLMAFYTGVGYASHEQRIIHLERAASTIDATDRRLTILELGLEQAKKDIDLLLDKLK